jgi:hypothetical protein
MKKTLLLLVIAMVLSAGLAFSQGVPIVGEWKTFLDADNDGGDSDVTMTNGTRDGMTTYIFKGGVTTKFQYGFVGWQIDPDAATLAALKKAKGISFKCIGDGKRYTVKFRIDTVTDWAHHEYSFNTRAGEVMTIDVPLNRFMQPAWAGEKKNMNTGRVFDVSWQTHEVWREGGVRTPFEITIWDVRVY